jgi:hypothetical protein
MVRFNLTQGRLVSFAGSLGFIDRGAHARRRSHNPYSLAEPGGTEVGRVVTLWSRTLDSAPYELMGRK